MATLTVQNLELVNKVLKMSGSVYPDVPICQLNIDCGAAIGNGDLINFPAAASFPSPAGMLTLCGFGGKATTMAEVFGTNLPNTGTVFAQDGNRKILCDKREYSDGTIFSLDIYDNSTSRTDYMRVGGTRGNSIYQCVSPAIVYYDAVGKRYLGLPNGPVCYSYTDEYIAVNKYGIIQPATQPKYAAATEEYTWSVFSAESNYLNRNADMEAFLASHIYNYEGYDPYAGGGTSSSDIGGDTNFDTSSDSIVDSALPTISAANTGFTRIYNPTLAQVQSLANYLWTDQSIISTLWNHIKQFLENPMDAFIAFNLLPCTIPDGGTVEFKIMYIPTGVNITAAASQFVDVNCGTLKIDKHYDSALDYSPYTKISIFLPYIGSVQLDTDDVMGKTISVKYRIDIVSGGCVAKIFVDDSIHYQYSGHCAITIPFTSADFTGYISAMIQAGKTVASLAAGAAGNAPLAASLAGMPEQRTSSGTVTETVRAINPETGRMRNVGSTTTKRESTSGTKASFSSIVANNFENTVGAVMGSKSLVDRSGAFSGNTGYLGVRRPFVVIERPRMCNPAEYGKYNGRPSMMTLTLGNCKGYTQVQQVQLTGFSATNPELDEIGNLLKSGVIL